MSEVNSFSNAILFTRGTKGDLYPFLRIGSGLQKRGCKISLLSNYCYEEYARNEQFDFVALDDEELFERLNNTPAYHISLPAKLKLSKDYMIAYLEKEVEIIESKVLFGDTVIIAHSNDYLAPLLVSEKYNIPLYLCMLAPSYVHGFTLFEAILGGLSNELNDIRAKIGLSPVGDWKKWLNSYKECFAFWPQWFSDEIKKNITQIQFTGFLSIDSVESRSLQKEIIRFIDGASTLIVITHGTSRPFDDLYFDHAINACQQLGCKLIVSTPFRNLLPGDLPDNILWVDYCPFNELLPFVDLIIHHGGIGTTSECIAHAVPQLIVGQGFDRQHNGRIIKKLNLGDWIIPKELNLDKLYSKISLLLGNTEIISQNQEFQGRLYDQVSLENFYETVTSKTEPFPEKLNHTLASMKVEKAQKLESYEVDSSCIGKVICNASEGGVVVNQRHTSYAPELSRQDLLQKLLKSKTKDLDERNK